MPVQRSNSFTPRGKKKGDKLAVFDNMRQNGAGWGEALVSIFKGHQMTDEQAAICIQAYWRRYATIIHSQRRSAAPRSPCRRGPQYGSREGRWSTLTRRGPRACSS